MGSDTVESNKRKIRKNSNFPPFSPYRNPQFVGAGGSALNTHGSDYDSIIIAHEIGHNLGAQHAGFESIEYGNPYSVMGQGSVGSRADPIMAGKLTMGWADATSIKDLTHPSYPGWCAASANCKNSGTYTLQAHDAAPAALDTSIPLALRIATKRPDEYYWIEFRQQRAEVASHALITWSPTIGSEWGHSQLIDARKGKGSSTPDDAGVPSGSTFIIDLDEIGAVITVGNVSTHANGATKLLEVTVSFEDLDCRLPLFKCTSLAISHPPAFPEFNRARLSMTRPQPL